MTEVPAALSATSLSQQWYKPGGKNIQTQPVIAMTLVDPSKPSVDIKRKPLYTEDPKPDIHNSSTEKILKLKNDPSIPLSYLLQENTLHIPTRLGNV